MSQRNSQTIPLEQYHGVPSGWSKAELIAEHQRLGGNFSIDGKTATEPGAPAFLPCCHTSPHTSSLTLYHQKYPVLFSFIPFLQTSVQPVDQLFLSIPGLALVSVKDLFPFIQIINRIPGSRRKKGPKSMMI